MNGLKRELIEKFNKGELKVTGYNEGISFIDVVYGIEDYVFGYYYYGADKRFFLVKINYTGNPHFFVKGLRYNFNEILRVGAVV